MSDVEHDVCLKKMDAATAPSITASSSSSSSSKPQRRGTERRSSSFLMAGNQGSSALLKTPVKRPTPASQVNKEVCENGSRNATQNRPRTSDLRLSTSAMTPERPIKLLEGKGATPGRKTPSSAGDRFIPRRAGSDLEKTKFRLVHRELSMDAALSMSPSQLAYKLQMEKTLYGELLEEGRMLAYGCKRPATPDCKGMRASPASPSSPVLAASRSRRMPQAPEKILDAPDIINDYYLNLLDWSWNNLLAVALDNTVYIWNSANAAIERLVELTGAEEYVSSVRWVEGGHILAVGNSAGAIELWDVSTKKRIRSLRGHRDRVGSLSWNNYILSSGSRSGAIHHADVRLSRQTVSVVGRAHSYEVCGLAWSPDGRLLASGANDNLLKLWSNDLGGTDNGPLYSLTEHKAAVKALAWCPWQSSLLASGGGTSDRTIKLWSSSNGTLLRSVETTSQVCALLWSADYRELVSGHGHPNNEVSIWKYPSMARTADLLGHSDRVLHLSMSPDGSTVVSAAADETLRLWKCFPHCASKRRLQSRGADGGLGSNRGGIR